MFSFWEKTTLLAPVDVLVIGSGIVGLHAAIHLKEQRPHWRIVVAERGFLPTGASTKNAGFACFGSASELLDDLQVLPPDEVFALVERRYRGLLRLRQRLGDARIDYQPWGNYEAFGAQDAALFAECQDRLPWLNRSLQPILGIEQTFQIASQQLDKQGLKGFSQLIWNKGEGQIHTGKMMQALLQLAQSLGIEIWNGWAIDHLEEDPQGIYPISHGQRVLCAQQVLVATNGFARQLLPQLEVQPARNQVICTEPIPQLALQGCFHYHKGYVYFRNIEGRILLGGGRHLDPLGETTSEQGLTDLIQDFLIDFLRRHLHPTAAIAHRWSGTLGIGPVKRPIVEQLSERLTVAVRMGGMGVAIGSLVGEQGAEIVLQV